MKCVKVSTKDLDKVVSILNKLIDLNCLSKTREIIRNNSTYYIPLIDECNEGIARRLGLEVIECNPRTINVKGLRVKELISKFLGSDIALHIPTSFDIIGDIALLPITEDSLKYAKVIAFYLTLIHKKIKSVYAKGAVRGFERIRELKLILGEDRTETIHKEHGLRFYVDIGKVYFNPRLATEHARIASYVNDGEIVLDMFAGIGCFGIHIASRKKVIVYAVDINPYAIFYGLKSLYLNKLKGKIVFINCDASVLDHVFRGRIFDRIIMNLPQHSLNYLPIAYNLVKNGGSIHVYIIARTEKEALDRLSNEVKKLNLKFRETRIRCVLDHAPHEYIYCIDCIGVSAMKTA